MEELKLQITSYLECHTNSLNTWVNMQRLINDLSMSLDRYDNDWVILFNVTLYDMNQSQEIRIDTNEDGSYKIALERVIKDRLNAIKESALSGMKEELQKHIDNENYMRAAEYRDLINKYELE